MAAAPILLFAIGNESRGDDALAPLFLRKLGSWLDSQPCREDFELIEDFQLQIEHAMDMVGRQRVIFIDAGMDTPAPYAFYPIVGNPLAPPFSHALLPEAVLATYAQVYGKPPPPSFVLCLRGEQFELGSPLSTQAERNLESALGFMQDWVENDCHAPGQTRI